MSKVNKILGSGYFQALSQEPIMTQVWMLRNSDTDIHMFNRYEHLLPSVRISYSRCTDVLVNEHREANMTTFKVSGKRDGQWFSEDVVFLQRPVWTEPSHL